MLITAYTTYADVRAALGVSEVEVGDTTLALRLYEDALHADLEDVALTIPETYASLYQESAPTTAQVRFLQAARLFATYAVARHLTVSVELFSPMQIADGKATMGRTRNPHTETIRRVNEQFERWRSRLLAAFGDLGQSVSEVPRVYFSVVSPSSDPITGV